MTDLVIKKTDFSLPKPEAPLVETKRMKTSVVIDQELYTKFQILAKKKKVKYSDLLDEALFDLLAKYGE